MQVLEMCVFVAVYCVGTLGSISSETQLVGLTFNEFAMHVPTN